MGVCEEVDLEELVEAFEDAGDAVAQRDQGRIRRAIYDLKSATEHFTAKKVPPLVVKLSELCKGGRWEEAEETFRSLTEEVESLKRAIATLADQNSVSERTTLAP